MYIGGYELDEGLIASPNTWADEYSLFFNTGEISGMYKGIFIMPEHRLYGKSRTDDYATYLTFCNAKEAAADFHALAESIKRCSMVHGPSQASAKVVSLRLFSMLSTRMMPICSFLT